MRQLFTILAFMCCLHTNAQTHIYIHNSLSDTVRLLRFNGKDTLEFAHIPPKEGTTMTLKEGFDGKMQWFLSVRPWWVTPFPLINAVGYQVWREVDLVKLAYEYGLFIRETIDYYLIPTIPYK